MSIFSDLFASAKTFDATDPKTGISRSIVRELRGLRDLLGDPTYDAAGLSDAAGDEVQVAAAFDTNPAAGSTSKLTFSLENGESFTTAAIAFDATAADIQTAVDTAADGTVTGYTAGDIAVTSAGDDGIDTEAVTFTFSGDSVLSSNHGTIVVAVDKLVATPVAITVAGDTGVDQIQVIEAFINVASGTYTLTIDLTTDDPFTTAAIDFDATAAEIETAIDVAATAAAVPAWTNGDITVTDSGSAGLSDGTVTLTFDGDSVDELNHTLTVVNAGSLVADPDAYLDDPSVTTSSSGTSTRPALAALVVSGIITGTLPEQGDEPASVTAAGGFQAGPSPNRLSAETIEALCIQAEIEDERPGFAAELLAIING